ncbi:OCIA domain-containing protein 1-like isoform X2 [Erpetoichthys calabaricus]|uniref:OCIA domain-containing protein 1 n=1 Tax=Erpetoichthys calabaricus TaxID=27687 RepID=A0A8C4SDS5_ERPCA|nr:OCIA domain-containing protein 1-like isoform X2 [Erpetoichthys calabaricus]
MAPESSAGVPTSGQRGAPYQNPLGMAYVPTEEERRVFKECNDESFWYRSLPFAAVGMFVTQGLIARGILTSSARFGSVPKVAFAGVCGYLAGKMSYMKTCQEKFKTLDNSPLGEALRRGHRPLPSQYSFNESESVKTRRNDQQSSDSSTDPSPAPQNYSDDFSYTERSLSTYDSIPFSTTLSESAPTDVLLEEERAVRKPITYEELRSKNRENYEVTMTQKTETMVKPPQEKVLQKKDEKKNKYGDTWEE